MGSTGKAASVNERSSYTAKSSEESRLEEALAEAYDSIGVDEEYMYELIRDVVFDLDTGDEILATGGYGGYQYKKVGDGRWEESPYGLFGESASPNRIYTNRQLVQHIQDAMYRRANNGGKGGWTYKVEKKK